MLMQVLLVASAVAAFLVGYAMADFQLMLLVYAGGVVLTALVTVPNWPFFNRHPLKWLDAAEADRHPRPQISSAPATTGVIMMFKNTMHDGAFVRSEFIINLLLMVNVATGKYWSSLVSFFV
ncbi:putative signal peptidase complex subunit 1 [Triticum urartu]|uniref:Signal peptidase complex subunit 1 n=3 Tax=Triticum TaxID=4564 RepID=A0A9R0VQ96_TRITD|nr:putative signal peptidase complex subunit 1 [Triticum urartu]VAH65719.1 unnamed protein product [Triticum turgidum subsp. durum]